MRDASLYIRFAVAVLPRAPPAVRTFKRAAVLRSTGRREIRLPGASLSPGRSRIRRNAHGRKAAVPAWRTGTTTRNLRSVARSGMLQAEMGLLAPLSRAANARPDSPAVVSATGSFRASIWRQCAAGEARNVLSPLRRGLATGQRQGCETGKRRVSLPGARLQRTSSSSSARPGGSALIAASDRTPACSRISRLSRSAISWFSRRNALAFSRPWPIR